MQIKVNGEMREIAEGSSMLDLICSLGLEERVMASALNMEIVKKDRWGSALLSEGDTIELLDFVGGG
ncbi:MAG: sulfur carrier protein ThiS [Sulfuricurvum sp.]|uniref:sulfur carrier protein ThiS n=1 Tax=Sulfuricurvum sp. TaxID=2025608 RepID=UPI0025D271D3|nr:sulfur carrier protein ThiS [Sulfuricurvum sp.]MBV5321696.1 sulfur carrier protein ThiS [Sulfuricurvum sp.]